MASRWGPAPRTKRPKSAAALDVPAMLPYKTRRPVPLGWIARLPFCTREMD